MNLDKQNLYQKYDTGKVAESMELLPDQMRQVLSEARLVKVPREYSRCTHVVVNGMGGSNIGTRILKSAFADRLKLPVEITPGYEVPAYVGKNTLYVISSYSGTTEEPLSVYRKVKKRGAKVMAISEDSSKSKLKKLMLKDNIPGYIFKPEYNPSNQPRLGLGYSIFGQAVMLAKAGLFKIEAKQIENIINKMELWTRRLRPRMQTRQNNAKKLARELENKQPQLVAAEFLSGNVKALRNQMSECSKQLPGFLLIPDMNHFAMEGLAFPKGNRKNMAFLFFDSGLYTRAVQKRFDLTKQVVKKNGLKVLSHKLKGEDRLAQSFELLQLGAWITYYLGILNQIDPAKIPYVDWFKEELKRSGSERQRGARTRVRRNRPSGE